MRVSIVTAGKCHRRQTSPSATITGGPAIGIRLADQGSERHLNADAAGLTGDSFMRGIDGFMQLECHRVVPQLARLIG
jgi:hypothetical protein